VILAIEVGDECIGRKDQQHWDFPPTIKPDTDGEQFGIIYDLVGYILVNYECSHFTARYVCPDDKSTIYTYDSM
jgi:hypothetical protein